MKTFLLICICLFSTSCASIVSSRNYDVSLNTEPSGAEFSILDENGAIVKTGVTPATVNLPAGGSYFDKYAYTVKYSKPGYGDSQSLITTSVDGWYWANILIGGLIGCVIVDPLTGAMYEIDQQHFDVNLVKDENNKGNSTSSEDLSFDDLKKLEELKKLLDKKVITNEDFIIRKRQILDN